MGLVGKKQVENRARKLRSGSIDKNDKTKKKEEKGLKSGNLGIQRHRVSQLKEIKFTKSPAPRSGRICFAFVWCFLSSLSRFRPGGVQLYVSISVHTIPDRRIPKTEQLKSINFDP